MQINKELIDKLQKQVPTKDYESLYDYYKGNHRFINTYNFGESSLPVQRLPINYPAKIVDFFLGTFLGKEISYSSRIENDPFLDKIQQEFLGWEARHNVSLMKKVYIKGKSFELCYVDKLGRFRCTSLAPDGVHVLTDNTIENNILAVMRKYKIEDVEYIDIYTDTDIITYQKGEKDYIITNQKTNIFGEVPIKVMVNNDEEMGIFEKVLSLIDMYDLIFSLAIGEVEYFREAYLALEGMEDTENEEIAKLKANRVLKLPQGGKASFLIKDIKAEFIQLILDKLAQEIVQQSNIVLLSTAELSSNISGVALKTKLQECENLLSINEIYMKEMIYERLRMFAKYLSVKEGKEYNFSNIIITFSRNVPTNLKEIADIVGILSGKVSNSTLISQLPFVTNVTLELKRLSEEKGMEIDPEEVKKIISENYNQYTTQTEE